MLYCQDEASSQFASSAGALGELADPYFRDPGAQLPFNLFGRPTIVCLRVRSSNFPAMRSNDPEIQPALFGAIGSSFIQLRIVRETSIPAVAGLLSCAVI